MSRRPLDMLGVRSGKLVAIERAGSSGRGQAMWRCKCDCGGERLVSSTHLNTGFVSSCGCKRNGRSYTLTFRSWQSMRDRCLSPNAHAFEHYGGRGITICERWNEYASFLADMGERPSREFTLDRIDVNGNYEPSNCRWATKKQQGRNTRFTKLSERAVKEILELRASGVSNTNIAKRYGVCRGSIDNVIAGRAWK